MLSEELKSKKIVIGAKQTYKAILDDEIERLFIAEDADKFVLRNIIETAELKGIHIEYVDSMKRLGKDCGIDVGAATVGVLKL